MVAEHAMTNRWVPDQERCGHGQFECLRCGNTGCAEPTCPSRGFDSLMCRSCGHIERVTR
jgi:hypothetical protein